MHQHTEYNVNKTARSPSPCVFEQREAENEHNMSESDRWYGKWSKGVQGTVWELVAVLIRVGKRGFITKGKMDFRSRQQQA